MNRPVRRLAPNVTAETWWPLKNKFEEFVRLICRSAKVELVSKTNLQSQTTTHQPGVGFTSARLRPLVALPIHTTTISKPTTTIALKEFRSPSILPILKERLQRLLILCPVQAHKSVPKGES